MYVCTYTISVYMCIYVYIGVLRCVRVCVHMYLIICILRYVRVGVCNCAHMCLCMSVCVCWRIYVRMSTQMCVCMCVYADMYLYDDQCGSCVHVCLLAEGQLDRV
jgi:hypothetical protein